MAEVTKYMREHNLMMDKSTGLYVKKTEATVKDTAALKENVEEEKKSQEVLAREAAILEKNEELKVQLMAEGLAKFDALQKAEVEKFRESKAAQGVEEEILQKRISLIKAKYTGAKAGYLKQQADKELQVRTQAAEAEIALASQAADNRLQILEREYSKGKVALEQFMDERRDITTSKYEAELAAIQEKMERAAPGQKVLIEIELRAKKEEFEQAMAEVASADETLKAEQLERQRSFDSQLLQMKQEALDEYDLGGKLASEVDQRKMAFEAQLQAARDAGIAENQIAEMAAAQRKVIRDQEKENERAVNAARISTASAQMSMLGDIFGDVYTASGEKLKIFFYMQRAAAIAQAIMDAHLAALKVQGQLGMFGIPMSAMIYAQAMARVAMIAAQTVRGFAEGGLVKGKKGADQIPARLSDREYVMSAASVRKYGEGFFEALNRRKLDVAASYPRFPISRPSGRFQTGGQAKYSGSAERESTEAAGGVNIVNVIDPNMMDQYVATTHGQRNILNVLSSNAFAVKQILAAEG